MPIGVVLGEQYTLLLESIEQRLRMEPDVRVLAACTEGDQLIGAVRTHRPDVLVIDLNVSRGSALRVLLQLREERLATRAVLLAESLNDDEALEAMRLGVKGVVLKEMASRLLIQCIRTVYSGGTWVEKRSVTSALNMMIEREASVRELGRVLTPRQMEVVRNVALGLRGREIASRLRISEGTVKVHLHQIYERLGLKGRFELLLLAREKRLI